MHVNVQHIRHYCASLLSARQSGMRLLGSVAVAANALSVLCRPCDCICVASSAAPGGVPHTPTGMINLWGVPKPSMRAFELLNLLGDTEAEVTLSTAVPTLTVLASAVNGSMRLVLANHACPTCPEPSDVTITKVSTSGHTAAAAAAAAAAYSSATVRRIDSTHSNPHAAWEALGSPNYPRDPAIEIMRNASELVSASVGVACAGGEGCHLVAPLMVPAHGVVEVVFNP